MEVVLVVAIALEVAVVEVIESDDVVAMDVKLKLI